MIETFNNEEVCRMIKVYRGSRFLGVRNQLIMVILFDSELRNLEVYSLKMDNIRGTYINVLDKGKKTRCPYYAFNQ